jgi:hypothetical protein
VIISASYKTDIPTFYGEWFVNRLRAGYCRMVNPYNHKAVRVSLLPGEAEGFVFWTKNVTPFLRHLPEVRKHGFPFVVQHTINAYPRTLEFSVVDSDRSIESLRRIAEEYGPKVCVWRYDPILATSVTPFDFHLRNFEKLARRLEGATDEVVVSFAHFYRKTLRNMAWAADEFGFTWQDPGLDEKRLLVASLAEIAKVSRIQLSVCSQRDYIVPGAVEARCVDADRFEQITGRPSAAKLKGNRKECGCFQSRDIGEYDTCPHGCVYCYAVQNRQLAQTRFKEHDPESEFLFATGHEVEAVKSSLQLPLFPQNPGNIQEPS